MVACLIYYFYKQVRLGEIIKNAMEDIFEKVEMTSLSVCMNKLVQDGYDGNFIVNETGMFVSGQRRIYRPSEVIILNFYRFEGESDPADNSILYVLETNDGIQGLLSDSYGMYSDPNISKFIGEIEVMRTKTHK
jgi:hypothetical protein